MYNIIALIGKSGSGKDTIMKEIIKQRSDLHEIISCTTRPKRENEIDGVNYYFLTPSEFTEKVLKYEMLEATCFNDWFYGTSYDSLDKNKINIGVFNPEGIENLLLHRSKINLTIFYIKCSDKERLIRQLNREEFPDIDEILRRYKTDKEDFSYLDFNYIELDNNTLQDKIKCVNKIIEAIDSGKISQ